MSVASAQTGSAIRRIEITVGYACNQGCRFCAQRNARGEAEPLSDAEVMERVRRAAASGATVVLTGGEVTLRPALFDWVRAAREAGAARVEVQTNGQMLAYRGFARRLRREGAGAVHVALHGASAAAHDWHTQVPGSFERAVQGIQHAVAAGLRVWVSTVVTRSNFRHLVEIVDLAISLRAYGWRVRPAMLAAPRSTAFQQLVPRYELLAPHLQRACSRLASRRRRFVLKDVPPCVAGEYAAACAPGPTEEAAGLPSRPERVERVFGEPCEACAARTACPGVPQSYARRYGWDEFEPVGAAAPPTARVA